MTLIDLFFSEVNILIYVLHEITFRRAVAAGLHLHDQGFGAVVLAVCALGAKFSDDSRVFLEHSDSEHTAGWVWFRQVRLVPPSLVASPSLYEIQLILVGILRFFSRWRTLTGPFDSWVSCTWRVHPPRKKAGHWLGLGSEWHTISGHIAESERTTKTT